MQSMLVKYSTLVLFLAASVSAVCLLAYAASPPNLAGIERSETIPWDFGDQPIPRYKHGMLLAYDSDKQTIRWFPEGTNPSAALKVAVPGAAGISIRDISASPDGTLAAAATATDEAGNLAPVIVWIKDGAVLRVVGTLPFAAFRIAFARDGTLWAVGRVYNPATFEEVPGHLMLRQYDPAGVLLRTLLPREGAQRRHPAYQSFLVTATDRVGLYCVTGNEWIEISLWGDLLGRWKITPPPGVLLSGAALTDEGEVFVSGSRSIGPGYAGRDRQAPVTPIYRMDKSIGALIEVNARQVAGPDRGALLLAADSGRLIFYTKPGPNLSWVRVE
jgi:hypothetical protein